jgi:hypothetical protein
VKELPSSKEEGLRSVFSFDFANRASDIRRQLSESRQHRAFLFSSEPAKFPFLLLEIVRQDEPRLTVKQKKCA